MMEKSEFYKNAIPNVRGPLVGLRVLEATIFGAGPMSGMVLCDLGAESIRCEMPGAGDTTRSWPPSLGEQGDINSSIWYLTFNRGKKGVTLDFRKPEGQALFKQLAAHADVVVENFTPGTMDKWNLGYQDIRKVKPDIIYVSVSGFGQFGPLREKKGLDQIAQAMGGVMSATGEKGGQPLRSGYALGDNLSGWLGAMGALAALTYRDKTGRGQWVDASMCDAILYVSDMKVLGTANAGYKVERMGNGIEGGPFNTYVCKDGSYVFIHAVFDAHWARFCEVMGCPELAQDARTKTWDDRARNIGLVDQLVGDWVAQRTVDEVIETLDAAGVTVAPVLGFPEIIKNAHFRDRESVVDIDYPKLGKVTTFGVPVKYSTTPARVAGPAPELGQHNAEVYGELLGLDTAQLAELKAQGII
jgi:crotonobetainyl-CoA:carnitine CoA-transferase CaiB-like acyl-CoA transferase